MKKLGAILALLSGIALLMPVTVFAVPASPDIVEIIQPNQAVVKAYLRGDEWNNWVETLDGYTIAGVPGGYWHYVSGYDERGPILEDARAGEPVPAGLQTHIRPHAGVGMYGTEEALEALQKAPTGTFNGKVLFILASFSNRAGTYKANSFASFIKDNIKDYFSDASYGKVTLSPAAETHGTRNNGVVGWLNLGYAHPNTGATTDIRNQQITKDAILKANRFVNFKAFDKNRDGYVDSSELAVVVIVAGFERAYTATYTPSVWGHRWSLDGVGAPVVDGVTVGASHGGAGGYAQFGEVHQSEATDKHQASMGIMVHELGHLIFGLPDLYDTDKSSSGVGGFCLMGGGNWGKSNSDDYSGETPVLPSAWIKYNRSWVAGTAVGNETLSIQAAGSGVATSANTVFRKNTDVATEYFLAENRRPLGYDMGLQRWLGTYFGGIAIWHVDETVATNTADTHRKVDLEEADGIDMGTDKGSAKDLWYAGNETVFDNRSNPDTKKYNLTSTCIKITAKTAPANSMSVEFKKTETCPCEAEDCGTYTGICNPTLSCFCFRKADGDGDCVDDFWCSSANACATDDDCPSGRQCFYDTCCPGKPNICGPKTCTGSIQGVSHLSNDHSAACTFKY
jgi:M6 family metalloprotease-like protein